mgnify:CR=1 FL=1
MSQYKEEWPVRVTRDKGNGLSRQAVREVLAFGALHQIWHIPARTPFPTVRPEIRRGLSGIVSPDIQLESLVLGVKSVTTEMPLSDEPRPVACISDRKSTRLNSSHVVISYAVFCLKKKTTPHHPPPPSPLPLPPSHPPHL